MPTYVTCDNEDCMDHQRVMLVEDPGRCPHCSWWLIDCRTKCPVNAPAPVEQQVPRHTEPDPVTGQVEDLDPDQAFSTHKAVEYQRLKDRILILALGTGEFHADNLADYQLTERNMIGAAVRAQVGARLLVATGERRAARHKGAHGRTSAIYRLTDAGRQIALDLMRRREAEGDGADTTQGTL